VGTQQFHQCRRLGRHHSSSPSPSLRPRTTDRKKDKSTLWDAPVAWPRYFNFLSGRVAGRKKRKRKERERNASHELVGRRELSCRGFCVLLSKARRRKRPRRSSDSIACPAVPSLAVGGLGKDHDSPRTPPFEHPPRGPHDAGGVVTPNMLAAISGAGGGNFGFTELGFRN